MFGTGKEREADIMDQNTPSAATSQEHTMLGQGASFSGDLRVQGDLVINGEFEGTIACTGDLQLGKTGRVKAEVECVVATIAGRMEGKIFAKGRVELQGGSHFEGDVQAKSFMIQEGVFFQGNCSMGDASANKRNAPAETEDGRKPELGILKQS
jgi:cytoskeletal protein CcmA (bactofilin family)